ncbi:glycoside hydrolase family 25 protein [Parabacteroides sp. FAFU027]|uniref:glycoside hydrolase family 25 protein n=1 Tax=Parabacteroides sp. FAFU027 TaxID=2922715 RepID=UPI001FAFF217|nr:GH25 family lysozyme [Parabacteroides sp. FAFU027]
MAKKKKKKAKKKINSKTRAWIAVSIVLLLTGVFLYFRLHRNPEKIDPGQITGIDVSKHTGRINWEKIKMQNVDFAYVKSTEGVTYIDPCFSYNFREAKRVGIPVGVYHFFRFNRSGEEQAQHFMKNVSMEDLNLPPVVDVEEWGQYNQSKDAEKVSAELRTFIDLVEEKCDHSVIIYSDKHSYSKYIQGRFDDNDIWICSLGTPPEIDRKWTFWQNSHTGKYKGARGKVDVNVFNGDREKWSDYLAD